MVTKYDNRPSIKEILSEEYWQNKEKELGLSWKDDAKELGLASMLSILTGSGVFFVPYLAGLGQKLWGKLGIKCIKKIERTFNHTYPLSVLSIAVCLHETEKKILGVEDTSHGSIIEAELPADLKSFKGKLIFEINEEGPSKTFISGTSIVKGQLFDSGKGKNTLCDIFSCSEQFLRKTSVQK